MSFPAMVPENGIPRGAVITLGALILIGAYGAWYFLSTKDMYVADLIPPVPDAITRALEAGRTGIAAVTDRARNDPSAAAARQAEQKTAEQKVAEQKAAEPKAVVEPTPAPVAPSIAAPAPTLAPPPPAPAQPVPSAAQPAQAPVAAADAASHDDEDDEVERTPPPSLATTPAQTSQTASQMAAGVPTAKPAAPAAPEAAPVALDDRGGVDAPATGSQLASLPGASADPDRQIVLKANVDSWIQIRDTTENKLVLTRLLRKGEEYAVPAREGLTLVTGNAGGLDVTVGGDSTPSLGPIGVVRRNILLDPERLRAGTAIVE
jgi:cytoskeleton protein RodZ